MQGKSEVGMILVLDISMEAPVITMPRNSSSKDAVEVDLGSLHLSNTVAWRNGTNISDRKVIKLYCISHLEYVHSQRHVYGYVKH